MFSESLFSLFTIHDYAPVPNRNDPPIIPCRATGEVEPILAFAVTGVHPSMLFSIHPDIAEAAHQVTIIFDEWLLPVSLSAKCQVQKKQITFNRQFNFCRNRCPQSQLHCY